MTQGLASIGIYLGASPLPWIVATLWAYLAARWLYERSGRNPLFNSVLVAIVLTILLLKATGTDYGTYFAGAQYIHFLLGPATVALAVPLYGNLKIVRRSLLPLVVALIAGSTTAILSAVGIAWALGADGVTVRSLAPKSVTTPIAMAISEQIGGIPALAAVMVILTGIIGIIVATPLLKAIGIRDPRALGLAIGTAAHGIGTARAFQIGTLAGTFAGAAMALNGFLTALLVPLLASLLR